MADGIKLEKLEIDTVGALEREMRDIDNWAKNMEIIESKPKKIKTERIQIENTGNFLEIKDGIVNIPLELIVFPFFTTRKSDREVNFEYQFKDMGLTMYSSLLGAKVEGKDILQPGTFEKKIVDYIITKFEEQLDENNEEDFISFEIKNFIVNFLGNKMNDRYYTKIEDALRNMKYTTYSFGVRNHKKAGNFAFESKTFNLLNYEKIKQGKSIFYKIYLHNNITSKIKEKRYVKFKLKELSSLEKKDAVALRIYQYISMRRFSSETGEYRIELLAAIIPLKTFATQRKKNKKGEIKEYRVSMIKQVLKRVVKAFDALVDLEYLDAYDVIEVPEEKSYKIRFRFGGEGFHVSDYIKGNRSITNSVKMSDALLAQIEKTKKNIFFSKKYNSEVQDKIKKISDEYGDKTAIDVLKRVYESLKREIKKGLVYYIDGVLKNTLEEEMFRVEQKKLMDIEEETTVYDEEDIIDIEDEGKEKEDTINSNLLDIFYDKLPDEEKVKIDEYAEKIWLDEESMSEQLLSMFKKNEGVYSNMIIRFRREAIKKMYS